MPAAPADHARAARLASAAGELLLELRSRLVDGADPDEVRAEGDARSHAFLVALTR